MGRKAKATKKFEKNKLKETLERRKEFAKIKQRHRQNDKRKHDAAKRHEHEAEDNGVDGPDSDADGAGDMDDDKFFQDALPLPQETAVMDKKRKRRAGQTAVAADSGSDDGSLADKDPEFYKYLQENDAELLDFGNDLAVSDNESLCDDVDDGERPSKKAKTAKGTSAAAVTDVTPSMLTKWKEALGEQYSQRSLREVVLAFRAAIQSDDQDDKLPARYGIPNSSVYHQVLLLALKHVHPVLQHHLPIRESAAGKVHIATDTPKFKALSPIIKSHASSLYLLLGQLSDAATLRITLQSLEPLLPYLLQLRKQLKLIIKTICGIWADNSSDEATRISAFIIIRRLMVIGDAGIRESVLKSTYEGIVKGARNLTEVTLPGVNLMKNSAAEIYGIDQKISYTTAFKFIRQLAIHLRGHIAKPTKDSYKQIYNWQFVHSLDFWSRVLSSHCNSLVEAQNGKQSQLRPLIYPLTQITLGVMRLIPTSTYFPLRFLLIRSLLRISQATGTYIPLSAAILEVLNSSEMKRPAKAATLRPLNFESVIRAPSAYLKTRIYQDGVGEQVLELFSDFFVLWTKSIAYPELQLPTIVMLKRWLKTASKSDGNKNGKLNQALLLLVQKSEANAKWIEERRNKVNFAPKDRAEVEAFLKDVSWEDSPLGAFVVGQRKMREERRKVVQKGREEERKKRDKGKNVGDTNIEGEGEDDFEGL
ncbi:hypothetical protein DV736_g960, partial [Chaetothyriales sp. CBS 134916]